MLGALSVQTASSANITGSFEYVENIDPLDDADRSFIVSTSLDQKAYLSWKCSPESPEGLDILLVHDDEDEKYEEDKFYSVAHRFDKKSAMETDFWTVGISINSLVMDYDYINDFTFEALQSNQLVLRPIKPGFGFASLIFKLDGLKQSLAKMSCYNFNWVDLPGYSNT